MDNPYQKLNDLGFSSDLKDYTFKSLLRLEHLVLQWETHIPRPSMIDRGVHYARNWRRRGTSVMLPETHPNIHPFYSKTPSSAPPHLAPSPR